MLQIPKVLFQKIIKGCEKGYPHEVCGLLLGEAQQEVWVVKKIIPAKNLNSERARDRYELDPKDFLRADELARAEGLEIIGIYHSHPDHPPEASKTDTERAWESYSYLILAIRQQKLDKFKSWRLNKDVMEEESVEVIHDES